MGEYAITHAENMSQPSLPPSLHLTDDVVDVSAVSIGFYREIAIAIQKESGDSNGGNV